MYYTATQPPSAGCSCLEQRQNTGYADMDGENEILFCYQVVNI